MEIKKPVFEKIKVNIREIYVDEDGLTRERVRTVDLPTGQEVNVPASEKKEKKGKRPFEPIP